MGRDPLLGHQNLCFSAILVIYGSPNCVIFCFVGRQLPNVEHHWSWSSVLTSCWRTKLSYIWSLLNKSLLFASTMNRTVIWVPRNTSWEAMNLLMTSKDGRREFRKIFALNFLWRQSVPSPFFVDRNSIWRWKLFCCCYKRQNK